MPGFSREDALTRCSICFRQVVAMLFGHYGPGPDDCEILMFQFPKGWSMRQWQNPVRHNETFSGVICPDPQCQEEATKRNKAICFSCGRPR